MKLYDKVDYHSYVLMVYTRALRPDIDRYIAFSLIKNQLVDFGGTDPDDMEMLAGDIETAQWVWDEYSGKRKELYEAAY